LSAIINKHLVVEYFRSMQKILIPTDFSDTARAAVRYAQKYVASTDTEYYILHAYKQPETTEMLISIVDILKEEADKLLNEESHFLQKELHIPSSKIYLMSGLGEVEDMVQYYVDKHQIDLVVMGTSGASGIKEFLVGTNTVNTIGKVSVPVLAIPQMKHDVYLDTIVLALDNEGLQDEKRLQVVKKIADENDAEIVVLNVSSSGEEPFCFSVQQQNTLKKFFSRMDIECISVHGKNVEEEINNFVADNEVGMIVLLPRKMSLMQRLFGKKSVTKKINFHSKVPVLSIG